MKPIQGFHLITPEDLSWRPSNQMRILNADYLERTGSENLGARLWRLPPKSANTMHKHIRAEEFYFVLEGTGRLRVSDEALSVPRHGGGLVGPESCARCSTTPTPRRSAETKFHPGAKSEPVLSLIYPVDPTPLPKDLAGVECPPKS